MFRRFLFMLLAGALLMQCDMKQEANKPPNIVLILIDDLGWKDLGYMGSEYYETPNIDKLANQGMIFTQAYSNAANCAPTRASLLTGQYTPRHGVFTVASSERGESAWRRLIPTENNMDVALEKVTIAEALKSKGYVSAAIGKWHIGHSPAEQGFDFAIDRYEMGYKGGHFNEGKEYLTDKLTEKAEQFIIENRDKPFFLYLAHHAVHTPIQAKEEIINDYLDKEGVGCHNDATYAAMIKSVDESVGRVFRALEDHKLSDHTLVIFISDNGGYGPKTCMQPLRGAKGMYYEGGIRVPMFAYWPGRITPGSKSDVPVITTDFFPTFLDLADAEAPEGQKLDGVSLLPVFEGTSTMDRKELFWHFPAYLESYSNMKEQSRDTLFRTRPVSVIRKDDWKLMLFHEEWTLDGGRENLSGNNAVELYNLTNDLEERNNLAQIEIAKRDELLEELLRWIDDVEAPVPSERNAEYVP
jgi:arylsulfatase A-like enzyme